MPPYFLRYFSVLVNTHTRQNPQLVKAQRRFHSLFSAVVKRLHLLDNQKMGLKPLSAAIVFAVLSEQMLIFTRPASYIPDYATA